MENEEYWTLPAKLDKIAYSNLTLDDYKRITENAGRKPNNIEFSVINSIWAKRLPYRYLGKEFNLANKAMIELTSGSKIALQIDVNVKHTDLENEEFAPEMIAASGNFVRTYSKRMISINSISLNDQAKSNVGMLNSAIGTVTNKFEADSRNNYNFFEGFSGTVISSFNLAVIATDNIRKINAGELIYYIGDKTYEDGIIYYAENKDNLAELAAPTKTYINPLTVNVLNEISLSLKQQGDLCRMVITGADSIAVKLLDLSEKEKVGFEINMEEIPIGNNLDIYQMLTSKTPTRALLFVPRDNISEIEKILTNYDIGMTSIGKVIEEESLIVGNCGKPVMHITVNELKPLKQESAKNEHMPAEKLNKVELSEQEIDDLRENIYHIIYSEENKDVAIMQVDKDHYIGVVNLCSNLIGQSELESAKKKLTALGAEKLYMGYSFALGKEGKYQASKYIKDLTTTAEHLSIEVICANIAIDDKLSSDIINCFLLGELKG